MSLALDEPKETDEVYHRNGVRYVVDGELRKRTGEITIDYVEMGWRSGFTITSERPIFGGVCSPAGGCGSAEGTCPC